jgi:thioredoxin-dependent peroxiredoxin
MPQPGALFKRILGPSRLDHKRPLPFPPAWSDSARLMSLKVGDQAPDFEVTARQAGQDRALSLRGILAEKNLVLYFYPKDFTTVCTREACGFRDAYAALTSGDTEVVGVSVDDAATHDRFAREHGLTFPLVPDPERRLARAYQATSRLRDLMGVVGRVTYVIARSGRIEGVFDSAIRASQHVEGARETIARLRTTKP